MIRQCSLDHSDPRPNSDTYHSPTARILTKQPKNKRTMCQVIRNKYLCEAISGGNKHKHRHYVPEGRCGEAQRQGMAYCDDYKEVDKIERDHCYDRPTCCKEFLRSDLRKWARYWAGNRDKRSDHTSRDMGRQIKRAFRRHERKCGLSEESFARLLVNIVEDYGLMPEREEERDQLWDSSQWMSVKR